MANNSDPKLTENESLRAQLAEATKLMNAQKKAIETLEQESGMIRATLAKFKAPELIDLPDGSYQLPSCLTVVTTNKLVDAKAGDVLTFSLDEAAKIRPSLVLGQRLYVVSTDMIAEARATFAK